MTYNNIKYKNEFKKCKLSTQEILCYSWFVLSIIMLTTVQVFCYFQGIKFSSLSFFDQEPKIKIFIMVWVLVLLPILAAFFDLVENEDYQRERKREIRYVKEYNISLLNEELRKDNNIKQILKLYNSNKSNELMSLTFDKYLKEHLYEKWKDKKLLNVKLNSFSRYIKRNPLTKEELQIENEISQNKIRQHEININNEANELLNKIISEKYDFE